MRRGHLVRRKELGLHYWHILDALDLNKDQVAQRIGVHKSSVCRAFTAENAFAFSIKKLRRLRELVGNVISSRILAVFELGPAKIDVLFTDYATGAQFDKDSEDAVILAIRKSLASLLGGDTHAIPLPSNVVAATLQLGRDQECVYIIKTRNADASVHEYEHLADLFRMKARRLKTAKRKSQAKLRLPKTRLG